MPSLAVKAVEIRAFGGPEGLDVTDLAEPSPAVDAVTLGSSGVVAHFALAHARFALEFRRAAALTRNIPERTVLLRRAAAYDERT